MWAGPVAGPELQRHVLAARRDDARAHRARRAGLQAARAREPLQRRRQRVAGRRTEAKAFCPPLNIEPNIRYPVLGAALQRRGGTARHDAVAWGYARAADALGVDIIENCEVTGIRRDASGAVEALETSRGPIRCRRVGVVGRGQHQRRARPGRRAVAARELPAAGARLGAREARHTVRRDVELRARLHQPVRQGRARDRRRHGRLHELHAARRAARQFAHAGGDLRAVPDVSPPAHAAQLGRYRRRDARSLADHRQDARARVCT